MADPNKDQVLFWMHRAVSAARDRAEVDHPKLARQGKSYSERIKAGQEAEKHKVEHAALKKAQEIVQLYYEGGGE